MAFKFPDLTDEQRKTSKHLHTTENHDTIAKLQDDEEWLSSSHNTGHPHHAKDILEEDEVSALKEVTKQEEPKLVVNSKSKPDATARKD